MDDFYIKWPHSDNKVLVPVGLYDVTRTFDAPNLNINL